MTASPPSGQLLRSNNIGPLAHQPVIADIATCSSGQAGLSECVDTPVGLFAYSPEMPSADSFGEVLLKPQGTFASLAEQRFNFGLSGRYSTGYGPSAVFAQVKYFKGFLQPCFATLVVLSHTEFAKLTPEATNTCRSCADYWAIVRPTPTTPMPAGFCWQASDYSNDPPLNGYFLIRSEITDDTLDQPIVDATIAWGCTDGQDISNCSKITLSRTFPNGVGFWKVKGRWYLEPHDAGFLIDRFRAGAAAP
ncbi:MAG: hypothetical protein U0V87_13960 [Acidobacteriota bacterium]